MLVLSRKVGERIRIGDGIVLTVVGGGRAQVRLGIEAPADVVVLREEIRDRPGRSPGPNSDATQAAPGDG